MDENDLIIVQAPCAWCHRLTETKCAACKEAHYCARKCQKSDWKKHKLICGKMKQIEPREDEDATPLVEAREDGIGVLDEDRFEEVVDPAGLEVKVEVRESPIHGRGVFATKDIKKGEKVGHIQIHALRRKENTEPKNERIIGFFTTLFFPLVFCLTVS